MRNIIRWLALRLFNTLPVDVQFAVGLHFINKHADSYLRWSRNQRQVAELYFHPTFNRRRA